MTASGAAVSSSVLGLAAIASIIGLVSGGSISMYAILAGAENSLPYRNTSHDRSYWQSLDLSTEWQAPRRHLHHHEWHYQEEW
jgi:hypothetical protein